MRLRSLFPSVPGLALALAAAVAAPAQAAPQSPPARSAEQLTRDLNSGPPAAALPRPAAASGEAPGAPRPGDLPDEAPDVAPDIAPEVAPDVTPVAPVQTVPNAAAPTRPEVGRPDRAPDARPGPTALDAAARMQLPFTLTLPAGAEIIETPSGPGFDTWAVRRGETTLVRLYAGPASQFPVYDGDIRTLGGRATVVVSDGMARRAMEHLFERDGVSPREIHVLVASLEGENLALAEAIGQSVDPR